MISSFAIVCPNCSKPRKPGEANLLGQFPRTQNTMEKDEEKTWWGKWGIYSMYIYIYPSMISFHVFIDKYTKFKGFNIICPSSLKK